MEFNFDMDLNLEMCKSCVCKDCEIIVTYKNQNGVHDVTQNRKCTLNCDACRTHEQIICAGCFAKK